MFFFQLPWLPELMLGQSPLETARLFYRLGAVNQNAYSSYDFHLLAASLSQPGALTAMLNYYRAMFRYRPASVTTVINTPTLVISPSGADAKVVLDGSRSSDPDGDPLHYVWYSIFNAPPATPIATGVVAVVSLPVGTHAITLVVDDGLAGSTNRVVISVLTAGQGTTRPDAMGAWRGHERSDRPRPLSLEVRTAISSRD